MYKLLMDNYGIEQFFQDIKLIPFHGVFTRYMITPPPQRPSGLIVNTDNLLGVGKHWCAMYWDSHDTVYFFDPLGDIPFTDWLNFMRENSSAMEIASVYPIQPPNSEKCGAYCVLFLLRCYLTKNFQVIDKRYLMQDVTDTNIEIKLLSLITK